jgi:hypothetical protein
MPYKDKEKQKKSQHESYLRNKERIIKRRRDLRISNRIYVRDYKSQHPCAICGMDDEGCKDFHHLGDKDLGIANAACFWGLKRLKEEISKCQVLCANCHRKIHVWKKPYSSAETATNIRRIINRKFISEYKKTHCCEICGEDNESCLEFHHYHGQKKENIYRAIVDWGLKNLKEEVSKCQVLCANCHRKKHYVV